MGLRFRARARQRFAGGLTEEAGTRASVTEKGLRRREPRRKERGEERLREAPVAKKACSARSAERREENAASGGACGKRKNPAGDVPPAGRGGAFSHGPSVSRVRWE